MNKTIVLYTRRNVGLYALSYLIAKGYKVKVITDDEDVKWMAKVYNCEEVTFDTMGVDFSLFLCVHGNRILKKEYLQEGRMVNVHPMLEKYKGKNPISRYITHGDLEGSVSSHFMTEIVDEGEIIHTERFYTGKVDEYSQFYNLAVPFYFRCIHETIKKVLG